MSLQRPLGFAVVAQLGCLHRFEGLEVVSWVLGRRLAAAAAFERTVGRTVGHTPERIAGCSSGSMTAHVVVEVAVSRATPHCQ